MAVAELAPERIVAVDEGVSLHDEIFADAGLGRPPSAVDLRSHGADNGPPPRAWERDRTLSVGARPLVIFDVSADSRA